MAKLLFDSSGKLIGKGVGGNSYVKSKGVSTARVKEVNASISQAQQDASNKAELTIARQQVNSPQVQAGKNITPDSSLSPIAKPIKGKGKPANVFYSSTITTASGDIVERQIRRQGSRSSIINIPLERDAYGNLVSKEQHKTSVYDVENQGAVSQRSYRNVRGERSITDTPYYMQGEQVLNYIDANVKYAETLKSPRNPIVPNVPTGEPNKPKSMTFPEFGAMLNEKISNVVTKQKPYKQFLITGEINPRLSYGDKGKNFSGFLKQYSDKPQNIDKAESFFIEQRKGYLREGIEKPIQSVGIIAIGAGSNYLGNIVANSGKIGAISTRLFSGVSLGIYGGSAIAGTVLSENKGEYIGRELFKFSAFSLGASLTRSPITSPNKQDIKNAIKQGGFEDYSNKDLKNMFGDYAVKARQQAVTDFSSNQFKDINSYGYSIDTGNKIPANVKFLSGSPEIQIYKNAYLGSRVALSSEGQGTLLDQTSVWRSFRTVKDYSVVEVRPLIGGYYRQQIFKPRIQDASNIQNALSKTYDYTNFKQVKFSLATAREAGLNEFTLRNYNAQIPSRVDFNPLRQATVKEFIPRVFVRGKGFVTPEAPDNLYGLSDSPSKGLFSFNKKASFGVHGTVISQPQTEVNYANPYGKQVSLLSSEVASVKSNLRIGSTTQGTNTDLFIGQRNANIFLGVASIPKMGSTIVGVGKSLNISKQLNYSKSRTIILQSQKVAIQQAVKPVPVIKPFPPIQKVKIINAYVPQSIPSTRPPEPTEPQPPEIITPIIPYMRFNAGFDLEGQKFKSFYSKVKTSYTPSFGAVVFNIRGKANLRGAETGIGLRPITTQRFKLAI